MSGPRSQPLSRGRAGALLVALVLVWGLSFPVLKTGLYYMPPIWFAAARMGTGCAFLMALVSLTGRVRFPSREEWPIIAVVGVLMMSVFPALTHTGMGHVDSGRASILAYLMPLWVTPVAILFLGERLTPLKGAGLALALAGVVVLFNPAGFDWSDRDVVLGNALIVLASIVWGAAIVYIRIHRWAASPLDLAPWQLLVATVLLSALALATEPSPIRVWSPKLVLLILFAGPVASVLTVWGVVSVTRTLPAITASLGFLATPALGLLFGALLRGEALTATNLAGLALVMAGLANVAVAEARHRPAPG